MRESKKQIQNNNAIKFRLDPIVMSQLRYQVVYKKLIRSLRKFYARRCTTSGFCLATDDGDKLYSSYLEFVVDEFSHQIQVLRIKPEQIAISLGALTHPKLLSKHFEGQAQQAYRVEVVYNYLYKFSFERLQDFINDPIMVVLFFRMMEVRAMLPLKDLSPINSLAEHEACLLVIKHSCFSNKLAQAYDAAEVLATFKRRIYEAKKAIMEDIMQQRAFMQLPNSLSLHQRAFELAPSQNIKAGLELSNSESNQAF